MSIMLLKTDDLFFVLGDLLRADGRALLARTHVGPLALPALERLYDRLKIITRQGRPFAEALAVADLRHDVGCVVLRALCDALDALALLPEHAHLGERARRVRTTLSIERGIINASYLSEANNAARNRAVLDDVREVLRSITLVDGITAEGIAELFIRGGEQIGDLLAQRAEIEAEVSALRAEEGPSMLHQAREAVLALRAAIASELRWRDDLPADLERRLFAALDARVREVSSGRRADGEGANAVPAAADDADEGEVEGQGAAAGPLAPAARPPIVPLAAAPDEADAPEPGDAPLPPGDAG